MTGVSLCAQGFPGDFGERGPPGPDGNPVSEMILINTLYCILKKCLLPFMVVSNNICGLYFRESTLKGSVRKI